MTDLPGSAAIDAAPHTGDTDMLKTLAALSLAAAMVPGLALALEVGTPLGTTQDGVRATLSADGYDVRKIENEDGQIEAYAVKDGQGIEIYVDAGTGAVTRIKGDN